MKNYIQTFFAFILSLFMSLFAVSFAHAAEITAVGENLAAEIAAGKTIIVSLLTAGAVLLGIFAGYRYLKKGANSA